MDAVSRHTPPDTIEARAQAAQAELKVSIDKAGLRDDPFRHPLQALSSVMGLFPDLVREMAAAVEHARQPIDSASVQRLETAAASGAARRAAELARSHTWRTLVIVAGMLVGVSLASGGFGYWAGRHSQLATKAGLEAAAFRDGPAAADGWLNFMRDNDWNAVWAACTASTVAADGGRKGCGIGLWLQPPVNPGPRTMPGGK